MNLRDQLLKSGLASKEQAKKAQKEAKQRNHQNLQAKKDGPAGPSEAERILAAQRESDRLLNQERNQQRLAKESEARAIDIMMSHDLRDRRAQEPYYFRVGDTRIACCLVTDRQLTMLEYGQLAIVSFDPGYDFFLVDSEHAEKIRGCDSRFIICQHQGSIETPND